MADFGGAPVATNVNVNPQQGIQTISDLIGLKRQQQQLQTGEYLQEAAKAEATTRSVAAQGQQEAAGFLKNFDFFKHFGEDGTLDANSAMQDPGFQNLSGPAKEAATNALLGIKSNQIKNKNDLATLNGNVVAGASRLMGALAKDPDVLAGNAKGFEKAHAQWGIVRSMYPDQGAAFADKFEPHQTPDNMRNPGDLANALRSVQMMGEDIAQQQQRQYPQLGAQVGPDGQLRGTAQDPATGQIAPAGGGSVPLGLTPAQLATTITLPNQQVTTLGAFLHSQGGGGKAPASAAAPAGAPSPFLKQDGTPRTAADDAPPPNAPGQVQSQFNQSAQSTNEYVQHVRAADEQYGTNVAVSTAIRNLLKDTKTGPGTQKWHDVLGAIGAPLGLSNVADYQQLNAWLERQSAGMRPTLGLPATNAGQQASETTAGTTQYQPEALSAKNDFNQALIEGLHQQRKGLDVVAGYSGNPSPKAVGAYQAAWANNFDPLIHEYKAAKLRGDADAVKRILSQLSPQEAKQLSQKGRNLDMLEKGQAPQ